MALVYVTDDEPNICKLVAFGLKDEGFETATFTDGNSLLEAIQKRKPDAIILDWMMPPPDGLTICRSLRSEEDTKYIPILLFAQVFVINNQNINIYNILQTTFKYMTKI